MIASRIDPDALTRQLITHLHRGGAWAYIWTPNAGKDGQRKLSTWSRTGEPLIMPSAWRTGKNLYFGIHPSAVRRQEYQRSTIETIATINCFPVEFDGKDFTNPTDADIRPFFAALCADLTKTKIDHTSLWKEAIGHAQNAKFVAAPAHYKALALAHVLALSPQPSVIVDSGGGYQCYFLLREPFVIQTEEQREEARSWIKRFVAVMSGDPGAAQLAQTFRLPGSRNYKPKYAPDFPLVCYVKCDLDQQYDLDELIAHLPKPPPPVPPPQQPLRRATPSSHPPGGASVIEAYNATVRIEDALRGVGYTPRVNHRFVRPGGTSDSVQVFVDDNTSYHFSSSDPLHNEHARSPFDVFCHYEFAGDVRAAVKAAASMMGLERPAKEDAKDWRPLLEEVKLWILTTPPVLQGTSRRTDGRNVKLTMAILSGMRQYNTTRLSMSLRRLALVAGLGKDTVKRGLQDVGRHLFTVETEHKAMTIITLNVDVCLGELRQNTSDDPHLSQLTQATTDEYSERMGTDPFLTGASHRVKTLARQAAIDTEIDYKTWLATYRPGLGEAVLLVGTTIGPGGSSTVAETMAATGRTESTVRSAYRKLIQAGLAESEQETRRSPKVYHLAPDFWRLVEELTPSLRTYGLAAERKDKYLRDSQLWAAKQAEKAHYAGDEQVAQQAEVRYTRLANQRLKETLPVVYPELSPAEQAVLAWEVRPPSVPHPAQRAKIRLEEAEHKRRAEWELTETARKLRQEGLSKRDAARQLAYAGYTKNEVWAAVHRVWPAAQGRAGERYQSEH